MKSIWCEIKIFLLRLFIESENTDNKSSLSLLLPEKSLKVSLFQLNKPLPRFTLTANYVW